MLPASAVICECFARDGLQHEPRIVPTAEKVRAIELFADLGFRRIEATSFSHPKYVPQFADAEEVLRRIRRRKHVIYKATCVNATAARRAVAAVRRGVGPSEISLVVSASEMHSIRNVRRNHAQMREELGLALGIAEAIGLPVSATIATAFGCPFSGAVAEAQVERWVEFFVERGAHTISLGDTTGMGNPVSVEERFRGLRSRWPKLTWIGHFHDTRGTGLANCVAALRAGVDHLDAAFGGLGGHPPGIEYGTGLTGNVATEDLVSMLSDMGVTVGVDLGRLFEGSRLAEIVAGRPLHARVPLAGLTRDLMSA